MGGNHGPASRAGKDPLQFGPHEDLPVLDPHKPSRLRGFEEIKPGADHETHVVGFGGPNDKAQTSTPALRARYRVSTAPGGASSIGWTEKPPRPIPSFS